MHTIKQGSDDYNGARKFYRETAAAYGQTATEAGGLSAIALALLAIEVQMARFNGTAEELLKMTKEDMI